MTLASRYQREETQQNIIHFHKTVQRAAHSLPYRQRYTRQLRDISCDIDRRPSVDRELWPPRMEGNGEPPAPPIKYPGGPSVSAPHRVHRLAILAGLLVCLRYIGRHSSFFPPKFHGCFFVWQLIDGNRFDSQHLTFIVNSVC